jgi:hypothetical protein
MAGGLVVSAVPAHAAPVEVRLYDRLFAVPFPGMGQQARFKSAMAKIIPILPRLPTSFE